MNQLTIDDIQDLEATTSDANNDGENVLVYARDHYHGNIDTSTEQLRKTIKHAREDLELGHAIDEELETAAREHNPNPNGRGKTVDGDTVAIATDSCETYPDGIEGVIPEAMTSTVDQVLTAHLDALADNPDSIRKILEKASDEKTTIRTVDENLVINPGNEGDSVRAAVEAVTRSADTPDRHDHNPTTKDGHHGRPPAGYNVEDGELVKNDEWHDIKGALWRVTQDYSSITTAARNAGISRRTVRRSINERPELYDLPPDAEI